jgi:hypothetical protein
MAQGAVGLGIAVELVGLVEQRAASGTPTQLHESRQALAGRRDARGVARVALQQQHARRRRAAARHEFLFVPLERRLEAVFGVARDQAVPTPEEPQHVPVRRVLRLLDRDRRVVLEERQGREDRGPAAGEDGDVVLVDPGAVELVVVARDGAPQIDVTGRGRVLEVGGGQLDAIGKRRAAGEPCGQGEALGPRMGARLAHVLVGRGRELEQRLVDAHGGEVAEDHLLLLSRDPSGPNRASADGVA